MAKRINLLIHRQKKPLPKILVSLSRTGKKIVSFIGIVFFVIFIFINYQIILGKKEIVKLESIKKDYLNYLIENKDNEAELRYFNAKEQQLKEYSKDDASFLPYYQVLLNALNYASDSAAISTSEAVLLKNISIDKNRRSEFNIQLANLEVAVNFMRYVESDVFLNNFDELVLTNFNLFETKQTEKSENYQFKFSGVFKKINDTL
jgi:hypothetical protein